MVPAPEGHRERLRDRFLAHEEKALEDAALLELLLCYAIPQRDVQTLAKHLIRVFGDLSSVLAADEAALCAEPGVKRATATLLKLVDHLRKPAPAGSASLPKAQLTFEGLADTVSVVIAKSENTTAGEVLSVSLESRPLQVFSKSLLKETCEILPVLPEATNIDELREFVRSRFHYSSETTRSRRVNYVLKRMFPGDAPDRALVQFASSYSAQQELRDVVFHRFCQSEPLMAKVLEELFLPAIGAGTVTRAALRAYLKELFPESRTLDDCGQAIVEALVTTGIAHSDRRSVEFAYREIALPSFAFIVHNVFPEPGMYSLASIESHPAVRHLFWNPDRILTSIYELRNRGLISKVSEIDSVRQFTTRYDLAGLVNVLKETQVRK